MSLLHPLFFNRVYKKVAIVSSAVFVLIAVVLYLAFLLATAWGISDYFGPPQWSPPVQ